jgi:hypothetical protein
MKERIMRPAVDHCDGGVDSRRRHDGSLLVIEPGPATRNSEDIISSDGRLCLIYSRFTGGR